MDRGMGSQRARGRGQGNQRGQRAYDDHTGGSRGRPNGNNEGGGDRYQSDPGRGRGQGDGNDGGPRGGGGGHPRGGGQFPRGRGTYQRGASYGPRRPGNQLERLAPPMKNLGSEIALYWPSPQAPGKVTWQSPVCLTNYYKLNIGKTTSVHFYTVKIAKKGKQEKSGKEEEPRSPEGPNRERRMGARQNRLIFAKIPRSELGDQLLAFDGREKACGLKKIPNDGLQCLVELDGAEWIVDIGFDKTISTTGIAGGNAAFCTGDKIDEALVSMAIILNHGPSLSYTPIGRGFYGLPKEAPIPINGGFELWKGFKQHILPGEKDLFLNLNYAITAFVQSGPLIELLPEFLELKGQKLPKSLDDDQIDTLNYVLRRCKATVNHSGKQRTITIQGVSYRPANEQMFDCNGTPTSVADYFSSKYHSLRFPYYPCAMVGIQKVTYFPLEILAITSGNPYRGPQSSTLVTDIIEKAAIAPMERQQEIRRAIGHVKEDPNSAMQEFGVAIGEEQKVRARVIPPPKLVGDDESEVSVDKPGVINFGRSMFNQGCKIERWSLVSTSRKVNTNLLNVFYEEFMRHAKAVKMTLAEPLFENGNFPFIDCDGEDTKVAKKRIESFVTKNKLDFVLWAINPHGPAHSRIKTVCDITLGIRSKCIKSTTVYKISKTYERFGAQPNQTILNILYGLNLKFDGQNVVSAKAEFPWQMLTDHPTLIIGMDVNHGMARLNPSIAKTPSTVGIVGTRNIQATLYSGYMEVQRKPTNSADREVLQTDILKPAFKKILINFRATSKRVPERIIVYRDGVSEGQFLKVLANEMKSMIEVCASMPTNDKNVYRPPITFVTVQKRHDTRYFPEEATAVDKQGNKKHNPVAGTVVDHTITSKRIWNFFMVSHEGIQGTSKPAHYTVLFDENGFNNDQLQSLTYYMCHLYGKCPRAVSIPAPTYYAHNAALRGAELGKYQADQEPNNPVMSIEAQEERLVEIYKRATAVSAEHSQTMFFL